MNTDIPVLIKNRSMKKLKRRSLRQRRKQKRINKHYKHKMISKKDQSHYSQQGVIIIEIIFE